MCFVVIGFVFGVYHVCNCDVDVSITIAQFSSICNRWWGNQSVKLPTSLSLNQL